MFFLSSDKSVVNNRQRLLSLKLESLLETRLKIAMNIHAVLFVSSQWRSSWRGRGRSCWR